MGTLAAAITEVTNRKPGPKCTVALALQAADDTDRAALTQAIADSTISAERLAEACKQAGIKLGYSPIARHRRRGCDCG